jgi:hypothetical protein
MLHKKNILQIYNVTFIKSKWLIVGGGAPILQINRNYYYSFNGSPKYRSPIIIIFHVIIIETIHQLLLLITELTIHQLLLLITELTPIIIIIHHRADNPPIII